MRNYCTHTIALAALAILGHKSAHSFPMGPVIAEPAQVAKNIGLIKLQSQQLHMSTRVVEQKNMTVIFKIK